MNLEAAVEHLDEADQDMRARDQAARDALVSMRIAKRRLKVADLFDLRRRIRTGLLLPEELNVG